MALGQALAVQLQFARLAFQRRAAYRLANWTGIAVNFFFFLVHAQIYLAFFAGRTVDGWRSEDAVLYFATSEALLMVLGAFPNWGHDLMFRIRSGEVGLDLARPVNLYERDLAERFGSALYFLAARSLVIYAGACWLYGLHPPLGPSLLAAPLAVALGVAISGSLWYLANATAFWTEHAIGPYRAMTFALALFGGLFVPLDFYPPAFRTLCDWLPFRAAIYTPVAVCSGKLVGEALALALTQQVAWIVVLATVARSVEARGVRRLVVLGG
jgi:ABC-2 type transport system permease protein